MRLVFDIETDGFLRRLSTIHCLVIHDIDTNETLRFDDTGQYHSVTTGLTLLKEADELWGHNIIGYDIPAITELFPWFTFNKRQRYYDTLILSRMFYTDMLDRDFKRKPANMPANLYGRHSLESWGYRLGTYKSDFGKNLKGDWSHYSPEMLEYCVQDVHVTCALRERFLPALEKYERSIKLEHDLAEIMTLQEESGFPFNVEKAQILEQKLREELVELSDEMRTSFPYAPDREFIPRRNNKTKGYITGAGFCKLHEFNPTSRQHIAFAFQHLRGWEPEEFTDTGLPKIDEVVLTSIGTEEAKKFARILELQKHLGQLSEGKNAWLKQVGKDGRIHHACMLNTNTGRMAHMNPNLAQVPSGHEYRELFHPGEGYVQVGADASGLELRCLAHYLARFDGGKFANEVVNGDIHQALADIYGTTRKDGKGVTYCLIYGGGDKKLGLTAGASKASAAKRGKEIRKAIMEGLDGFKALSDAVQAKAQTGKLMGIDGRIIRIQKPHAALNYLLQSCGAIICKLWVLRIHELLNEAQIDFKPLTFVHDEVQLAVRPEQAEQALFLTVAAMKDIQPLLNFRCDLDAEGRIGANWAECH